MNQNITRRDLLKAMGVTAAGLLVPKWVLAQDNTPTNYTNPTLTQISQYNPDLAREISNLPEFTDKKGNPIPINTEQQLGLENMLEMFVSSGDSEVREINDNLMNYIENVGGPDKKYNSLVEALYWIAQKPVSPYEYTVKEMVLDNNLSTILGKAWGNIPSEYTGPRWDKWKKHGGVQDRLNELELIDHFLRNGIVYISDGNKKHYTSFPQDVLRKGGGDCEDISGVQQEAGDNAGYPSCIVMITWGTKVNDGHIMGSTKWKDERYYHINQAGIVRGKSNGILGPFDTSYEIGEFWAKRNGFPDVKIKIYDSIKSFKMDNG